MLVTGILICIFALGFMVRLLFSLTIFAFPVFGAITAGMFMLERTASALLAVSSGIMTGLLILGAARFLCSGARLPIARSLIKALFVLCACFAGFHAVHSLIALGVPNSLLSHLLSGLGAVLVGLSSVSNLKSGVDSRTQATTPNGAIGET